MVFGGCSLSLNGSRRTVKYILIEEMILGEDWERKVLNISPYLSCMRALKSITCAVLAYLGFRKENSLGPLPVPAPSAVPVFLLYLVAKSLCVFSLVRRLDSADSFERMVWECSGSAAGSFLLRSVRDGRLVSGRDSIIGLGYDAVLKGYVLGAGRGVGSAGLLEKRPVAVLPPKREGMAAPSFFGYLESFERKVEAASLGGYVFPDPSVLLVNVCPC